MGFLETLGVKCVNELAIREKRVFLRTDFNFPVDDSGNIAGFKRMERIIPTIEHILEHNARLIVASHFGRPENEKDIKFTLEPFAAKLAEILDQDIYFFEDCVGMGAMQMVRDLKPGQILVLENLRFNEEERKGTTAFARELAKMCDVYIDDAFGVCHRKDASIAVLPKFVDTKGIGFSMKQEIFSAITRLPSEQERTYLILRYINNMTNEQIAELCSYDERTVYRIQKRAMENLRL